MEFGGWSLPPWPKTLIVIDFLAKLAAFFTRQVDMLTGSSGIIIEVDMRLRLNLDEPTIDHWLAGFGRVVPTERAGA